MSQIVITSHSETHSSLLEFPCRFPIKVMGKVEGRPDGEFVQVVSEIIFSHARLMADEFLRVRCSSAGRYVSITAVIEATSQRQLDTIYQALTDCEQVLVAL